MNKRDIVIIPVPFTDLQEIKLMPACIFASLREDNIICFLSSQIQKKGKYDIFIKKDKNNGLKVNSLLKPYKLFTLHQSLIHKKIGILDKTIHQKLLDNVFKIFYS